MTAPAAATLASVLLKRWGIRAPSPVGIAPLDPARCRFAGRAATMRYLPLREDLVPRFGTQNPEAPSFDAFDGIEPGEVVVIEAEAREDAGILLPVSEAVTAQEVSHASEQCCAVPGQMIHRKRLDRGRAQAGTTTASRMA